MDYPLLHFDGPTYGTLLAFVVIDRKAFVVIDKVHHTFDADSLTFVRFKVEVDLCARMLVAADKLISVVDYIEPQDPNDVDCECMVIHSLFHPYVK